jgi:type II secretory pathway pseudopilin PulG
MLVVIAIIGVLSAMVAPALPSILESKSVEKAAAEVSGVLETARAEAMAKRTYVYVCFVNGTNTQGNSEIRIGALASLDGTDDRTAANLRALSKVIKVDRAQITDYSELSDGMKDAVGRVPSGSGKDLMPDFTNNADYATDDDFDDQGIAFKDIQGFKNNFEGLTAQVVTITPQGEILDSASPDFFRRVVHFGIAATRREEIDKEADNGAIVTYYGGSGRIGIFRP